MSGRQQAMELAGIIPDVKQAYAEVNERYAGGNADMAQLTFGKVMGISGGLSPMTEAISIRNQWLKTRQFPSGGPLTDAERATEAAGAAARLAERQATPGGAIELRDARAELVAASGRVASTISDAQTSITNLLSGLATSTGKSVDALSGLATGSDTVTKSFDRLHTMLQTLEQFLTEQLMPWAQPPGGLPPLSTQPQRRR